MRHKSKIRVTVLLGGDSPERDVSLSSGAAVVKGLRERGHHVETLDPALSMNRQAEPGRGSIGVEPAGQLPSLSGREAFEWLWSKRIEDADVVFVALHGGSGEDGTVQALLEAAGAVYTGTGVLGSALAMNKDRSKALFAGAGIQTAAHILAKNCGDIEVRRVREAIESDIGFPVVVKPNCQGSSVGFSHVADPSELGGALDKAALFGGEVIVERFIPGREVTVAVLDGTALPVVEIIPEGGFYDYKRKYTHGTSRYETPARIEIEAQDRLKREALLAYHALSCRDYARVDFRLAENGEPYCLEVNTLPGMTGLSLVPMAAAHAGIDFGELVEKICLLALERKRTER